VAGVSRARESKARYLALGGDTLLGGTSYSYFSVLPARTEDTTLYGYGLRVFKCVQNEAPQTKGVYIK